MDSGNYWDYVSYNSSEVEYVESVKDLFKNDFGFISKYLEELYYVDSNFLYLSYVLEVPQSTIASLYGLSQYGVSKRIKMAMKKLGLLINKPNLNREEVFDLLVKIISVEYANVIASYYHMKTYASVSNLFKSHNTVRSYVIKFIQSYDELVKNISGIDKTKLDQIHRYIKELNKVQLYGTYLVKFNKSKIYGDIVND